METIITETLDDILLECPSCGKMVGKTHFSCASGRKGGLAGDGECKSQGGPEYYRALREIRKAKQEGNHKNLRHWLNVAKRTKKGYQDE